MSKYKFELYQDRKREWRWRFKHANGRTMMDSGEGYKSEGNARRAIKAIKAAFKAADITVVKQESEHGGD